MSRKSILIAGAGIGGLTAALCLRQRGFDVTRRRAGARVEAARRRHQPVATRGARARRPRTGRRPGGHICRSFGHRLLRQPGQRTFPRSAWHRRRIRIPPAVGAPRTTADAATRRGRRAHRIRHRTNGRRPDRLRTERRHRRRRHQGRPDRRRRTRRSRWHQFSCPRGACIPMATRCCGPESRCSAAPHGRSRFSTAARWRSSRETTGSISSSTRSAAAW